MIEYKNSIDDFYDLMDLCWSGALDRLKEIEELGLQDVFFDYLESVFEYETYTLTNINDFIWFEVDDWIEEHKGGENE